MRTTYMRDIKRSLLKSTFDYLTEEGLDNVSLRDLLKKTGVSQSCVYYWFEGKEDLFIDAVEWGLTDVTDRIFSYAFNNLHDLRQFFDTCLDTIGQYQKPLRLIYQAASSTVYGPRVRKKAKRFDDVYSDYALRLSDEIGYSYEELLPLVHMFVAVVLDYAVWDNREKATYQIECLYGLVKGRLHAEKAQTDASAVPAELLQCR